MNFNEKYVITIGRQFGSGGRIIGKALASSLGISYYDKELLVEAAKHAGISHELFERNDEKAPSFFSGMVSVNMGYNAFSIYSGLSSISDDALYRAQTDVIRHLAERESCVIVGRSADYALRDYPNLIKIFIHAPIESRVERITSRRDALTTAEARQLAEKRDKLRAAYYNFYTDKRWGQASSYDLTIDSSTMSVEDCVNLIKNYMNLRRKADIGKH